ncbi:MAG: 4'-phosphopantetheinyl transferase superfamily protein [Clostridia bacterium]|nr:4'-phosphopantetheinyl transferase superfamily protein [Clostridia bacterium]
MKWYKFNICDLTNEEYEKWYSLMDEKKKKRVERARNFEDKKRTVVGEMLCRKAIFDSCGIDVEKIRFDLGEHYKPYARDLNIEFNISHSGDMVVCAVDKTPIGIDIEEIRPIDLSIAKRICTDLELQYIFGFTPNNKDFKLTEDTEILVRFFEIWTAKEAYAKFIGKGLAIISEPIKKNIEKVVIDDKYVVSIVY